MTVSGAIQPETGKTRTDTRPSARAVLALTLVPELGPRRIRRLVSIMGGPDAALGASMADLASIPSVGEPLARKLSRGLAEARREVEERLEHVLAAGVELLPFDDPDYPPQLAGDEHAPTMLYVRGSVEALALDGVGLVGARKCSAYGVDQVGRFAGILAQAGWSIVSGGARGIDTAAHHAALRSGGVTVAVLGCGLDHNYPAENAELFEKIVENGGAVVSELPMSCRPEAKNFPARNRIIAGLSHGILVVEAGEKSGALITARLAGEMGREVMALPGRVDVESSRGCHALIRDGVTLVATPADVEEALASFRDWPAPAAGLFAESSETPDPREGTGGDRTPNSIEDRVLDALGEALTLDQLCERVALPPEQVRATVTLLEIRRRIRREGMRLVRNR
ncbi:MAG: DNA-processing protein DprA [Phycisphaera sp.]|nr:MAG: DNA-processing protein DprA [Phycisphaera sp.]